MRDSYDFEESAPRGNKNRLLPPRVAKSKKNKLFDGKFLEEVPGLDHNPPPKPVKNFI